MKSMAKRVITLGLAVTLLGILPTFTAFGDEAVAADAAAVAAPSAPAVDTGDTSWLLISTALVLMMTIPGLSLFYGGLVRRKNVLSDLMQCFMIT